MVKKTFDKTKLKNTIYEQRTTQYGGLDIGTTKIAVIPTQEQFGKLEILGLVKPTQRWESTGGANSDETQAIKTA